MADDEIKKIKSELINLREKISEIIDLCDNSMDTGQVDKDLLRLIKQKIRIGTNSAEIDDIFKILELMSQIYDIDEDLREEIKIIDLTAQYILTDVDKKFWIKIIDEKFKFGQGIVEKPNFTFSCTSSKELKLLYGELDAHSAYMAGDITFEGNVDDAMDLHELIEFGLKALDELSKEV